MPTFMHVLIWLSNKTLIPHPFVALCALTPNHHITLHDMASLQRALQYLWDPEPHNTDHVTPLVCLGQTYKEATADSDSDGVLVGANTNTTDSNDNTDQPNAISVPVESTTAKVNGWPQDFLLDVQSRIWLSYRTGFPLIPKSDGGNNIHLGTLKNMIRGGGYDSRGFTSDVGWGCMIRTSQSLLANALLFRHLGREWRYTSGEKGGEDRIVEWFLDDPSAPFSIHRFVDHGEKACGIKAGEWFGPSAAASSITALCHDFPDAGLNVYYNASGGDVYEDEVEAVGFPLLVLSGLRLGIENVNPVYWNSLRHVLSLPQSVGIAGGRPFTSHYFFGFQGEHLFYLDPHQPKPALKKNDAEYTSKDSTKSFHSSRIWKLHLKEMDPSMLVGFYIADSEDWKKFKTSVDSGSSPVIHISKNNSSRHTTSFDEEEEYVSIGQSDDDFIDVSRVARDKARTRAFGRVSRSGSGTSSPSNILVDSELVNETRDIIERLPTPAKKAETKETEEIAEDKEDKDTKEGAKEDNQSEESKQDNGTKDVTTATEALGSKSLQDDFSDDDDFGDFQKKHSASASVSDREVSSSPLAPSKSISSPKSMNWERVHSADICNDLTSAPVDIRPFPRRQSTAGDWERVEGPKEEEIVQVSVEDCGGYTEQ